MIVCSLLMMMMINSRPVIIVSSLLMMMMMNLRHLRPVMKFHPLPALIVGPAQLLCSLGLTVCVVEALYAFSVLARVESPPPTHGPEGLEPPYYALAE